MYSTQRPAEHNNIITVWAIPACQKIKVINRGFAGAKYTTEFLSICIKRGQITFYKMAAVLMNIKEGDLCSFVFLNDALYIFKSIDGNSICRLKDGGYRLVNRLVAAELNKKFGATKTMRYEIKRTNSEFGGNPLFELKLPSHLTKQYKIKNND